MVRSPVSVGEAFFRDRSPDNRERAAQRVDRRLLKRKVSLRDYMIRKLKREGTRFIRKANGVLKRVKPLKKVAKAKRNALRGYYALQAAFLSQPENQFCLICIVRREHGENILVNLATEVHHWAGRIGRLLCYVPFFRASCFRCREWPHQHAETAREWGLLAPPAQYNVFPGDR